MYKDYNDQLEFQRKWRKENRDKISVIKKRYYRKHPDMSLLRRASSSASRKNLEFNLTREDIIIPEVCPIFQVPFEVGTPFAMSIDRIDSSKGYIKGNIQVISRKANTMKSDATKEELILFAKWIMNEQNIHNSS